MSSPPGPGGFLPSIQSPPPAPSSATKPSTPTLPHPRNNPLPPGSRKESALIAHLDSRLLAISRRYETRFQTNSRGEGVGARDVEGGYNTFSEFAREVGKVVDLVWVSGTRKLRALFRAGQRLIVDEGIASLQLPSLLTLALLTNTALPSFPFSPRPTFTLLRKLDHAFASLLKGRDVESGEVLPGFSGGRGRVSVTEKVRVRGVVERGRVVVVEVAGGGTVTEDGEEDEDEDDGNEGDEGEGEGEDMVVDGNHGGGRWRLRGCLRGRSLSWGWG